MLTSHSGADGLVKLWDVGQRTCVSTNKTDAPEGDGSVWALAWQPEYYGALPPGKQFAVAGDDKKVSLYRAAGAV
jgi:WD repeat-containing protein 61